MKTSAQQKYIHKPMHESNVSGNYKKSDIVEQKNWITKTNPGRT
jgi:hypothetical protein